MSDLNLSDQRLRALIAQQAEDPGLWFVAQYASEGYLQQALRELHALVEAVLAAIPVPQPWEPIDTAPTDGRRVLLYSCEYKRHWFGSGYYFKGVPGDGEGWIAHSFFTAPANDSSGTFTPTHWMPLPEPPSAEIPASSFQSNENSESRSPHCDAVMHRGETTVFCNRRRGHPGRHWTHWAPTPYYWDEPAEPPPADGESCAVPAAERTEPVCGWCGGPHQFDTTVPSPIWNQNIRTAGLPDFLCLSCIVRAFARHGQSFTASLWGAEFCGTAIEIRVDEAEASDARALSDENTQLRYELRQLTDKPVPNWLGRLFSEAASASGYLHAKYPEQADRLWQRLQEAMTACGVGEPGAAVPSVPHQEPT